MNCIAALKGVLFNIEHLVHIDQVAQLPGFEDTATPDSKDAFKPYTEGG